MCAKMHLWWRSSQLQRGEACVTASPSPTAAIANVATGLDSVAIRTRSNGLSYWTDVAEEVLV
jgi:hypothetical protein